MGVSAALLYLFLRALDPAQMVAAVREANLLMLAPATAVYFAGVWLRAVRWRWLVRPFATVATGRLFRVILIGFAVNNVLPLRLGEVVRAYLLRRSHAVPVAATLGSILFERLLDVVALCALLAGVSLVAQLDGWLAALAAAAWAVVAGSGAGVLTILLLPARLLDGLLGRAASVANRLSPRLSALIGTFLRGIRAVRSARALLGVAALSIACWTAEVGLYYFVMLGFGFDSGVPSLVAGMVAANLATVIPSSPGYIGTFDVPLQSVLSDSFGLAAPLAASYTLVTHAVLLVPVALVGLVLLSREELSLGALRRGEVVARTGAAESASPATSLRPD